MSEFHNMRKDSFCKHQRSRSSVQADSGLLNLNYQIVSSHYINKNISEDNHEEQPSRDNRGRRDEEQITTPETPHLKSQTHKQTHKQRGTTTEGSPRNGNVYLMPLPLPHSPINVMYTPCSPVMYSENKGMYGFYIVRRIFIISLCLITVNPLYTDIRYNDKNRYNDN